jgi:glycosyltransferase involved in cell wall biosynthesis
MEPDLPARPRTFGYYGNLIEGKGVFDLVEAFALARSSEPDLRLRLAGVGRSKDEARLRALLRDRVPAGSAML